MRAHGQKRHGRFLQNGYNAPSTSNNLASSLPNNLYQDRINGNSVYQYDFRSMSALLPSGHNLQFMRSESYRAIRDYNNTLPSGMRVPHPKEGIPLQMLPTDLSKKSEMNDTFNNIITKKRKIFMRHMESHIAQSNNSTLNVCQACGERSEDFESFTNHVFGHCILQGPGICCTSCKMRFDNLADHHRHYQEAHVMAMFKCTICNEILENLIALHMHFATVHGNNYTHCKCKFCPHLIFHDKISAEVHVSVSHFKQYFTEASPAEQASSSGSSQPAEGNKQPVNDKFPECAFVYECSFCPTKFRDTYLQMSHILEKHSDEIQKDNQLREQGTYQPLQISISPAYMYPNVVESADTHKKYLLPKTYSCDLCNLTDIPSEAELILHRKTQHMKTKMKNMSLHCAYCNETCKTRNELENHMKSHQIISGKGKHKCNICDAVFTSSAILADHKLTHCKIVEGNSCVQCKAILTDEKSFYAHQLLHSNSPVKRNSQLTLPANCVICCQTLQNNIELNLHIQFHLNHLVKKYICNVCNSPFYDMTQNGVGICRKCSTEREFSSKQNLESVVESENNNSRSSVQIFSSESLQIDQPKEKNNLECRICKHSFSTAIKLQIHLIEHNFFGMNQYSCYLCSAVFTGANGLRKHMLEHGLQNRPYECNFCQMKFFFRTELDNHSVLHHSDGNNPPQQDIPEINRFSLCEFCQNLWPTLSFSEHMKTCSIRTESNTIQTSDTDNKIEHENIDHSENTEKQ